MLFGKLTATIFLAVVFLGQSESRDLQNWCSCVWNKNIIKCKVQYNYFNATEPFIKVPETTGENVGDFYYQCSLEFRNLRLDVRTCPSSICESKRGQILNKGDNCYKCKKEGHIVNCELNIRNIESNSFHDTGKCNDPRWYWASMYSHWTVFTAKTFPSPSLG